MVFLHRKFDEATAAMQDEKLRYIFVHELMHIKQRHLTLKLLASAASAVHWFNPVARLCMIAIARDCELACDRSVIERFGDDAKDKYMYTILETAKRLCAVRAYAGVKTLGGTLFLSETSEKDFMERRYANMKLKPTFRHPYAVAIIALAACVILGGFIIQICGLPENISSESSTTLTTGSALLDEGIRAYYGLRATDPITLEHLEGIKTIELRPSTILKNDIDDWSINYITEDMLPMMETGIFVEYVINGQNIDLLEEKPSVLRFEDTILKAIKEFSDENAATPSYYRKWWQAFYLKKDPSDPSYDDQKRAELIAAFPDSVENPYYLFDDYASKRERVYLTRIAYLSGLLDARYLDGGVFDASALATLPNLESAVFTDITPANYEETLDVIVQAGDRAMDTVA